MVGSIVVAIIGGVFSLIAIYFNTKQDKILSIVTENKEDIKGVKKEQLESKVRKMKTLQYELYHDGKMYIAKGEITHDEFYLFASIFEVYKSLGGNGKIDAIFKKVSELKRTGEL